MTDPTGVAGEYTDVLIQCFERRCLTYTPSNPIGWQVEAGNIGRHYHAWRYADHDEVPAPPQQAAAVIVLDVGHDRETGGALGVEYQHTLQTALVTRDALVAAGYVVRLTRGDNQTLLASDPALRPENAGTMDPGYSEGYAHATRALQLEPDLLISLHYNAAGNPNRGGLSIYYCDHGGGQNRLLAELVRDELVAALAEFGYTPPYAETAEDGTIGKTYGHLATLGNVYSAPFELVTNRMVGLPAVLTEPLFETNPTERALIDNPAVHEAFARAYVRAVNRYFNR
jgi:N-acetylmuramoyl-L-alanine amidase